MATPAETSRRTMLRALSVAASGLAASSLLRPDMAAAAAATTTAPGNAAAPPATPARAVPSLDSLAGEWISTGTLMNLPSVNNFHGSLHVSSNLLGASELSFPPLSMGGDCATLSVDGVNVQAHESRWYPYQARRRSRVGSLELQSTVRMAFEQQLVLLELDVRNSAAAPVAVDLAVDLGGYLRSYPGAWEWTIPRQYGSFSAWSGEPVDGGRVLTVTDSASGAATAYAFPDAPDVLSPSGTSGTAGWALTVPAGATRTIRVLVAAAESAQQAVSAAVDGRSRFTALFKQAKVRWEQRFADAFEPDNEHFSGHLPVLDTDDGAVRDLYYRGVLSVLELERTSYRQHLPRTYVTAGPQWGVTLCYFWDTALFAPLLVLLDPAIAREEVKVWLQQGIDNGYAVDALSGQLVGPWYSANDLSAFSMLLTYVAYTGDLAFLDETVAGKAVIDHLEDIALHWKQRVIPATGLADYGARGNLLEQVVNYVNQVPSLNAANVWMMREAAALRQRRGEVEAAERLTAEAESLLARVLALYVPGQGVWRTVHNDGTSAASRHIYDFDTIGRLLTDDLAPDVRAEMTSFVESELLDGGWMRALALSDPDAAGSLRPDQGSNGAYDAWPALAASAVGRFGRYDLMRRMLTDFDSVAAEGPFSQSHQLVSEPSRLVVWDRADLNPTSGVTVAAWVRADAWAATPAAGSIVSKVGHAGAWFPKTAPNLGYALRAGGKGIVAFAVAVGSSFKQATSTVTVPVGSWHHVVGTFDGQRVVVYIDGVQAAATTARGSLAPAVGANLMVGADPVDPESRFEGAVDDVRVLGRSLSAAEVAELYAGGPASDADPALALWLPLDEGDGEQTVDRVSGSQQSVIGASWVPGRDGRALAFARSGRVLPRISRQQYNENNGGAFTCVILEDLLGYAPDGERPVLRDAVTPRGVDARLKGLTMGGRSYSIVSDRAGLRLFEE
ncbi:LamG-like jellyroll fold domain-containing protein [Monashia sp. NPDC004114]